MLHSYTASQHTLEVVEHTPSLEVEIAHNLFCDRQFDTMTSKVNHTLGFICCNFHAYNKKDKDAAYKALV